MEDFIQGIITIAILIYIVYWVSSKLIFNSKKNTIKKFNSLPIICYEINKKLHTKQGTHLRVVIKKGIDIIIEEMIVKDNVSEMISKILMKHQIAESSQVDRDKIYSMYLKIQKYSISLSENKNNKKTEQKALMNKIKSNAKYTNEIKSLISFSTIQLLMPQAMDKNLLSNTDKLKTIIAFLGGASDYVSQQMNLNDEEAISFITYCLTGILYDFDENKFEEVGNFYLSIANQPKYIKIQMNGAQAYRDMFKDDADSVEIGMRLKKLL